MGGSEGGRGVTKPSSQAMVSRQNVLMHQISLVYFKQQIIGQTWTGAACDWSTSEQCEEKRKRERGRDGFITLTIMSPSLPLNSYYRTNNSCSTPPLCKNIEYSTFLMKIFLGIFKKIILKILYDP